MRVLLTEDVIGLGDIGDSVQVRPGYARNFLIPKGVAVEANSANAREIGHKTRQIALKKSRLKAEAEAEAERWKALTVQVEVRVGSGGKVFGSINAKDIADKLAQQGMPVDRRRIILAEPIKKIGQQTVRIKLHSEVFSEFTVEAIPAVATKEEETRAAEQARIQLEESLRKKAQRKARGEIEEGDEDSDEEA